MLVEVAWWVISGGALVALVVELLDVGAAARAARGEGAEHEF